MEKRDYIEDLIQENLETLNDNEPAEGHLARFEARLKAQHKKKRITFGTVWKVAAAVVFVLLATNQAAIYLSPDNRGLFSMNSSREITLASVSPEYEEVEFYYTSAINTGLDQWNVLNNEGLISEEEQEMMDEELEEFENLYKSLQEDLKSNPNDERVINAMLEYYQAKLSVINMIVNKLEEVKQQKNTDFETSMNEI